MKNTTLITGATSGIGLALAKEFARNGHDIVVVSRDRTSVSEISQQISEEFNVETIGLARDVTEPGACETLRSQLETRGIAVEVLVNNAGRGERGLFHESTWEDHLEVMRLNIEAPAKLTHLYLPVFLARGRGRILNVGSIAGFQPGPLLAVYHATKAFIVSFSEAIAEEYRKRGITVTCLCPGPTDTEFFAASDASNTRVARSETMQQDPETVAAIGYKATMQGEPVCIPGGMNKTMTFLQRMMPQSMQAKTNEMLYQNEEAAE